VIAGLREGPRTRGTRGTSLPKNAVEREKKGEREREREKERRKKNGAHGVATSTRDTRRDALRCGARSCRSVRLGSARLGSVSPSGRRDTRRDATRPLARSLARATTTTRPDCRSATPAAGESEPRRRRRRRRRPTFVTHEATSQPFQARLLPYIRAPIV